MASQCTHQQFRSHVLVDVSSGLFIASIRINCAICGEPFAFDHHTTKLDHNELQIEVEPISGLEEWQQAQKLIASKNTLCPN